VRDLAPGLIHPPLGVGTKPDMVGAGSLSLLKTWKSILEGDKWTLKHGYYCVKIENDRRITPSVNGKKVEADFFEKTNPWKSVSDRSRFGMRNLVESTSKLLIALIETK
jgi:hypothetical protein